MFESCRAHHKINKLRPRLSSLMPLSSYTDSLPEFHPFWMQSTAELQAARVHRCARKRHLRVSEQFCDLTRTRTCASRIVAALWRRS